MRKLFAVVIVIGAVATPVALAGDNNSRQAVDYELTVSKPNTSTGQTLSIDYINPADPQGKPPAVRRVVTVLPRGARFDTNAPGQCTASDAELMLLGPAACPEDSKLAEGVITLDTGLPEPARFLVSDTVFFNNAGELIYLNTVRGTGARVVVRGVVTRRRIITESPFLPGTPPDGAAIDTVEVTDPAITTSRGNYITTPPRCPARGFWIAKAHFRYDDGVRQAVRDRTPCSDT